MTTGASTSFETTATIISANDIPGNNGPQWKVQCKFPWTGAQYQDSVYLEQSAFPEAPANGIYRVEVAFRSLKNKQEGGKHSGTHYWMNNYYMNKIVGPADQMNPQPNNSTPWPGREEEAERNRAEFIGNTGNGSAPNGNPPANGNGGHYDPAAPYNLYADKNYGQIKGNCNNILMALESKLPDMWDDDGNPNFAMWVYWRDEIYNNFQAIDITVYEQGEAEVGGLVEEAKKLGAEAFLENMATPPPAPAPEPAAHYCEKHKIEYTKYDKDRDEPMYGHKWNENRHWCIEGNESLIDGNGQPVTEATML